MARLSSICGGTPGKPGDKIHGIAPQRPQPPQPPQIPKIPKASPPVERKKTDAHDDKTADDYDRHHPAGHARR